LQRRFTENRNAEGGREEERIFKDLQNTRKPEEADSKRKQSIVFCGMMHHDNNNKQHALNVPRSTL